MWWAGRVHLSDRLSIFPGLWEKEFDRDKERNENNKKDRMFQIVKPKDEKRKDKKCEERPVEAGFEKQGFQHSTG